MFEVLFNAISLQDILYTLDRLNLAHKIIVKANNKHLLSVD